MVISRQEKVKHSHSPSQLITDLSYTLYSMEEIVGLSICLAASGFILNSFILIGYLKDQCKGKALTACDQILFSMALTSIAMACSVIADDVMAFLDLCEKACISFNTSYIMMLFFVEASFWQTALLSAYYCVKLFNLSHYFFHWMDRMISSSTIVLLLGSAAFSFLINISFFWANHKDNSRNVTAPTGEINGIWELTGPLYFFNMMLGCCLPFLFNVTCISLSVGSLVKHVCRIRMNVVQSDSSALTGGPVRAISTMVLCATLDFMFCVDFVGLLVSRFKDGNVVGTIAWIVFLLYPIIRPIIIIIRNPQLKRRLVEICFPS